MTEIGIDLSGHHSKDLQQFIHTGIATVITVCDCVREECPEFRGEVNRYHWAFQDPARSEGSDYEVISVFRRVRDEIRLTFEAYAAGYRQAWSEQSAGIAATD